MGWTAAIGICIHGSLDPVCVIFAFIYHGGFPSRGTTMLQFQKTAISAEDEAYLHLQREIRLGRYAPGQRLVPEVVAAEIGTSRMPVRGALRRLASEGLVEIRANRGAVVRGLNQQEMLEVFEMRSVLEGLAMRNAVLHMNAEHLRRLSNSLELLEQGPLPTANSTSTCAASASSRACCARYPNCIPSSNPICDCGRPSPVASCACANRTRN